MEVVVLLFAIAGAALIVVPRLQRRKAAAHRPAPKRFKAAKPARARKANAAAARSAPAVASWSPPAADTDAWEDDLGWVGEDAAEPSPDAREAWEQWRANESPLAQAAAETPEAAPAEPLDPELPSVERWRARACEQEEWVEDDDDGLGWEGDDEPPAPRALWNAETPAPVAPEWSPTPVSPSASDGWNNGRDWSRTEESASTAPAFATASATDVAAPTSDAAASEPELGRTIALDEDDEWTAPVGRSWGAPAATPESAPRRASSPSRRSRVHPVLLVALYAAIGIGAVVLASTFLLGGSDPSPASVKEPVASATPSSTPTPVATPTASPTPDPAAQAAAASDFASERTAAVKAHDAAVARVQRAAKKAREHARAKALAREKARKAKLKKRGASTPAPAPTPTPTPSSAYTPPANHYTPPSTPAPTRKSSPKSSGCEFCIG